MRLDEKALQHLNEIGIALSKEHNIPLLLEKILYNAKELIGVDGGTIYTVKENQVHFEVLITDSLGIKMGGSSAQKTPFLDMPLKLAERLNDTLIVTYAVNHKETVHIKDAYEEEGFDFSGTRRFDEALGYRTESVLTVPIKDHESNVIAVLQLINPHDGGPFSPQDIQLTESIASQAGIVLTNQLLIANLQTLFDSCIRVISETIDEQSPSTSHHSKRVPFITSLLAEAVNRSTDPPFKEIHLSQEKLYELHVAALLHDCGKITTPTYLTEKKTKLEMVFDRIELINARYRALQEKSEKECQLEKLHWFERHYPKEFNAANEAFHLIDKKYQEQLKRYHEENQLIKEVNREERTITEELLGQLHEIALQSYDTHQPMLTPHELESLSVPSGNLTEKEREIMKHHVVMTYRMLSAIEFPRELKRVPAIAAAHHEWVNGKGYPLGLTKEQMPIQARILAIADVFEALSAPDRPYKKPLPLSKVLDLMQKMVDVGHLDPDLFALFTSQKVYLPYAIQYLDPDQIDI